MLSKKTLFRSSPPVDGPFDLSDLTCLPLLLLGDRYRQRHLLSLSLTYFQATGTRVALDASVLQTWPELETLCSEEAHTPWRIRQVLSSRDFLEDQVFPEAKGNGGLVTRPTVFYLCPEQQTNEARLRLLPTLRAYQVQCVLLGNGQTFDQTHMLTERGRLFRHDLVGRAVDWREGRDGYA